MAALSTSAEYQLVREAIQLLTTRDASGGRRDIVSVSMGEHSFAYSASSLPDLQKREIELARRLSARNLRKRVTPDFSY